MNKESAIEILKDLLKSSKASLKSKLHDYEEAARITGSYQSGWSYGITEAEKEVEALQMAVDALYLS